MPPRDPYFSLDRFDQRQEVKTQEEFSQLLKCGERKFSDYLVKLDVIEASTIATKAEGIEFENVSFARVKMTGLVFSNCIFKNCRFHFAKFESCQFHKCKFVSTNMHKISIKNSYIEPDSFLEAIPDKIEYANIGIHLFQTLMRNSRDEDQPERESRARYQFKLWQRYKEIKELKDGWKEPKSLRLPESMALVAKIMGNFFWGLFFGYGVRLRNYAMTTILIVIILTIINLICAKEFGLLIGSRTLNSFWEALYFTIISLTTVGYGDITPTTSFGRVAVSFQGIVGFGLFGLLTSMLYRKISP